MSERFRLSYLMEDGVDTFGRKELGLEYYLKELTHQNDRIINLLERILIQSTKRQ